MHSNKDTGVDEYNLYSLELTDEAFFSYAAIPSQRVFEHVDSNIGLLETNPYLGRIYDPVYDAARPDFPCRVLYCEHYGIYYRVDENTYRIIVFAIEDQRKNPENRFSGYHYAISHFDSESENTDQ